MAQENWPAVEPRQGNSHLCRILGIVALALIIGLAASTGTWLDTYQNLKAEATFNGSQFIIQNNDNFTWTDVQLQLNTDYKFNTPNISPHSAVSVEADQFEKDDKTRFNPDHDVPYDLYIAAKISKYHWSSWFYNFP